MNRARVGVVCGMGLEDLCPEGKDVRVGTPYGPSPLMRLASVGDVDAAFLLRCGSRRTTAPHRINYRANVWAFHELGVEQIIGTDVVQTLGEDPRRGDLAVPSDLIDLTERHDSTFHDEAPIVQIDLEYPFCPEVRSVLLESSHRIGIEPEESSVYVCVGGPRFRTPAENRAFRIFGGDIVGMALTPEVFLARELGICYAAITVLFDGTSEEKRSPSAIRLIEAAMESSKTLSDIITTAIRELPGRRKCSCSSALEGTVV